ncbi:hypothetical protein J6590_049567 [Homalodisca vitripennis]|nr:hypothetical protein J6590_049567 [Homalodisca vitripennis]
MLIRLRPVGFDITQTSLSALRARETANNGHGRLPTSHLFERLIFNSPHRFSCLDSLGLPCSCRDRAEPHFTCHALKDSIVKLDTDEEDVVIATAANVSLRKRKSKIKGNIRIGVHKVFLA